MARRPKFTIHYAPAVYDHVDWIERKYHRLIAETIKEQLSHTPEAETKNRKPFEDPSSFGATWELRFGPKNSFRVFYEVDRAARIVTVLALGVKEGNLLFISGEEFKP